MLAPSLYVNDLFDEMFGLPFDFDSFFKSKKNNVMNADVQEFDDRYQLELELPGYAKEDIRAELRDGYLTIEAEHNENQDQKDKKGNYIRRERYYGKVQRSFYVGKEVTQEDIKANFDSGVLKLQIPKKEAKPEIPENRYIAIQ